MEKVDWKKIERIFFVGIKGVGMMPLSLIAKEAGYTIAGSDIPEEFITDEVLRKNNIRIFSDFKEERIEDFFQGIPSEKSLLITTGAHRGYDNPQVKKAQALNIQVLNQGQALGIFISGEPFGRKLQGITVTGSHGKTTISAMMASAFYRLNQDPSFAVGTSSIFPIGDSGHLGNGEYFIAEGDEYVGEPKYDRVPKILYQKPKFAVINNIDFDHPDIYENIEDVKNVMTRFVNGMQKSGIVFLNSDDKNLNDIRNNFREDIEIITYGEKDADYVISDVLENIGNIHFEVSTRNRNMGDFVLNVPGRHNAKNALAVVALLDTLEISDEDKKQAVSFYKGCRRRMELVGMTETGAQVLDDYGHHPTEIISTLNALKKFYNKKIICVFQSHTYSRTKEFLKEFSESFGEAEELVLIPVFKSQRDTEHDIISYGEFSESFRKNLKKVYTAKDISDAVEYLKHKKYNDEYIILTIGAGDVYKVGYELKIE